MNVASPLRTAIPLCVLVLVASACSGGGGMNASPAVPGATHTIQSGGPGAGGGTTAVAGTNPLPATAPAPGVFFRESFGFGPADARPQGDKGLLRQIFAGTGLSGFWVEWPGSKTSEWTASGWAFAGASVNPLETLPSPLTAPAPTNGVTINDWRDGVIRTDDAIAPFSAPHAPYTLSADILPPGLPGSYVGFGISSSSTVLQSNLSANGQIWVRVTADQPLGVNGHYQVMSGNTVLATNPVQFFDWTPFVFTVDPIGGTVSVSAGGIAGGTWPLAVTGRSIVLEGQGVADDVIARTL